MRPLPARRDLPGAPPTLERFVGESLGLAEQLVDGVDPARPDRRVGEVEPDDPGERLRPRAALAEQRRSTAPPSRRPRPRSGGRSPARRGSRTRTRRRSPARRRSAGCSSTTCRSPSMSTESPKRSLLAGDPHLRRASRARARPSLAAARCGSSCSIAVHRDLAPDRGDRVLDPSGEQVEPPARVGLGLHQRPEGERLAEHGGGLGQRQRRRAR